MIVAVRAIFLKEFPSRWNWFDHFFSFLAAFPIAPCSRFPQLKEKRFFLQEEEEKECALHDLGENERKITEEIMNEEEKAKTAW